MRIDKLLSQAGLGSRKEVKALLKAGQVKINNKVVRLGKTQVDPDRDQVSYLDRDVAYQRYYYVMLNKPAGIISATEDRFYETVIDWVGLDYGHVDLFPVGRLDLDTTGLLLLTNNGQLAHQLLSPKKSVAKVYEAEIEGCVTEEDQEAFQTGLDLGDFITQPASLQVDRLDGPNNRSWVRVTLCEGKYQQVKRMFKAQGHQVLHLNRVQMGPLTLDPKLKLGDYRGLTHVEMEALEPYGLVRA